MAKYMRMWRVAGSRKGYDLYYEIPQGVGIGAPYHKTLRFGTRREAAIAARQLGCLPWERIVGDTGVTYY